MRIAKKTSGITSLLIAGIFLVSCSSNPAPESAKPVHSIPVTIGEQPTPRQETFNTHLNDLIRQLGDYDIRKQESAHQEILNIINQFLERFDKNPNYKSPELDYLISALKDASGTGKVVDAARQSRALRLYALIKPRIIIHPDVLKLYPEILEKVETGWEGEVDVLDWLDAQSEDIQRKSIGVYKSFLKSRYESTRYKSLEALLKLGYIEDVLHLLKDNDENIRR